jgi:CubicO group peptidase (beta-lactamase class C family)
MIVGLDTLITNAITNNVMPGANYCLIADGKKYTNSLGNKAISPSVEVNDIDTIYDMASLTKVVATTTAVMILLEQGKIRLYDSVKDYLPKFRYPGITVWNLMTHTAGLPSDVPHALYKSKEDLVAQVLYVDLPYKPGTRIQYSDIGYILLGMVVEAASGMTLDVFTKQNLFEPLEMKDSGYNPVDSKRCAPTENRGEFIDRGYVHDEKAYIFGGVAGHAGLFSTVNDISHFLEMILNDGVYKGKRILSKATIDLLFVPQVEEYNGVSRIPLRRGLGWIIQGEFPVSGDIASKNTIMHTGFTGTHIFIDRDRKIAFCMLTNRVHPTRDNNLLIPFRAKVGNYILSHF